MKIRIEIEGEGTHWYADSPDIEGFVALGDSLEEVRKLAESLIYFHFECENIVVEDLVIEETILTKQSAEV
jgi:predicted RNase H-like HicB family nuclease